MSIKIEEHLAKKGTACRSGEYRNSFYGITIHETANTKKGAGALNHAKYLQGSGANKAASWHYCVDDSIVTRSIPEKEVAWHSGNSKGNYNTISIEICVNSDGCDCVYIDNDTLYKIIYILKDVPQYGLDKDYCILGIKKLEIR